MPFLISNNNIRIYYEKYGSGVPIIFLHGFSLDSRMWQPQIDRFSKNHTVIVFDARGHGKSDSPETGYSREDRTTDLRNLLDYLRFSKVHLVGFSMGGGDALSFAIDHQERLHSLTLVGSVASGWQPLQRLRDFSRAAKESGVEEARQQYMDSVLSYYDRRHSQVRKIMENIIADFKGGPWLDPMRGRYEKRDDTALAAGIKVPTLIMVGQHDIFFRKLAGQLHETIKGARLEILQDAGHMLTLESPERFNSKLVQFLIEVRSRNLISDF